MDDQDKETLERIVDEILGDVEMYTESQEGPDGPWYYRSLTVRRTGNTVRVYDVDGASWMFIDVEGLPNGEEASEALKVRLDFAHQESMAEL